MVKENRIVTKKTIKPGKNLVASMVKGLKEQVLSFMNQGVKDLTMDFNGVDLIDSEGLGLLIATNNSLKAAGGMLKIKNMPDNVKKFFQTIHLDKHFELI
jgi:anti-anti-sigma factor